MEDIGEVDPKLMNGVQKENFNESVDIINTKTIAEAKQKFDNIISKYFNKKLSKEDLNLVNDFQQHISTSLQTLIGENVEAKKEIPEKKSLLILYSLKYRIK